MSLSVPLSIGSISSGALCSMGGATFARLASPGSRFLSFAMKRSCRVLPNYVLTFPGKGSIVAPVTFLMMRSPTWKSLYLTLEL